MATLGFAASMKGAKTRLPRSVWESAGFRAPGRIAVANAVPCGWNRRVNLEDRTVLAEEAGGAERHAVALGVEKIGLLPFRAPLPSLAVALALAVVAILGIQRIEIDDSLSQLFRSNSDEFRQYEEVTREFPSSEYDVYVVVSGKTLLERESIEKLRSLVTDLQLIDGARGIISMFSAREPAVGGGMPPPLFPDELPQGAAYQQLVERVQNNQLIRGKLLSDDGRLALTVLSLDPKVVESDRLRGAVADIRKTMNEDIGGSGLKAELAGVPVVQLEIRRALERDRCSAAWSRPSSSGDSR